MNGERAFHCYIFAVNSVPAVDRIIYLTNELSDT